MSSSPPSSTPSSSPSSSPQSHQGPANGVFRNGSWLCNCEPPRLATIRQVRKETSKHKDKKFYGCPTNEGEGNRCNMFVLMEEAKQRQWESFKSSGRSEKRQTTIPETLTPRKVKREPRKRTPVIEFVDLETVGDEASTSKSARASTSNPAPPPRSQLGPPATAETSTLRGSGEGPLLEQGDIYDTSSSSSDEGEGGTSNRTANSTTLQPSAMSKTHTTQPAGPKRKRSDQEDNYDEFSTSGEEEFMAVGDRYSKSASTLGKYRDPFITPSTVRTTDVEHGLPTPSQTKGKSVNKKLFESEGNRSDTADAKRQRLDPDKGLQTHLFGTDKTIDPTPSSSTSSPAPASPRVNPTHLTSEIMDLLKKEEITFATRCAVRSALRKYGDQAKGYERGRDVSRKAIKELEERCARLQARVDNLENGRRECRIALMDLWSRV
ncbi:hypothetical protein F5X98DRAFT_344711 [Xylaria grammica]|nr:hypothetical protein F5X98DRAFT_344711 [Xylaria grammica]